MSERNAKRTRHDGEDEASCVSAASHASSTNGWSPSDPQRRKRWLTAILKQIDEWGDSVTVEKLVEEAQNDPFQTYISLFLSLSKETMSKEIVSCEKERSVNVSTVDSALGEIEVLTASVAEHDVEIEKLEQEKTAILENLALKEADRSRDSMKLLEERQKMNNALLENKGFDFIIKLGKYLVQTDPKEKVFGGTNVNLEFIRKKIGVDSWPDILKIEPLQTVHLYICALATHGLVANTEFCGLWLIFAGDAPWRIRNGRDPNIKTGRVPKGQDMKQRIRLADYLGITVPDDVLHSRVPREIETIQEEMSADEFEAEMVRRGYKVAKEE